jgi:hypothetical protein
MLVVLSAKRYCFAYLLMISLASIGNVRAADNDRTGDCSVYVAIYQWMIFSETYPGALDGSVIVGVVGQGVPPYDVYLDGGYFNTQSGQYLLVDGLSAGTHTVQITDASGQTSNLLTVNIGILYPNLRAVNLLLEPIVYSSYNEQDTIQDYDGDVHGWLSFDMLPGSTRQYLNVRFIHLYAGTSHWLVRNMPLPPSTQTRRMWYRINITELGEDYAFLDYQWKTSTNYDVTCPPNPNCSFCCGNSMEIITCPQVVGNGSDDVAPQIGDQIPAIPLPMPSTPGNISTHLRSGMPNIDLDCEAYYPEGDPRSTDMNACAPAAAACGLQWLLNQHPEMGDDMTSLRTKFDSLKSYMNLARADLNGVRFDSAVIGELTLIDALQVPVRVSYQTILESGNGVAPLPSADSTYGHVAENEGGSGLYPEFSWYRGEMLAGAAVKVLVGWYSVPDANDERERLGGHWLLSTGLFRSDSLLGIWLQDDSNQCDPLG